MNDTSEITKPRDVILDVAMHLFGKQGYTGTSMRDIANGVGMLPGSLYAHIQSKEILLVEIVDQGIGRFLAAIERIVEQDMSDTEKLREAIKEHVAVVAENPERSLVVFHQWRFLGKKNIDLAIKKRRRYENAFLRIVEKGVSAGVFNPKINVKIAVRALLGALNWTPEWYSPDGPLSAEKVGNIMAETLMQGFLAKK